MLHDYNNRGFQGVKAAVADYEKDCGHLAKVPIPDQSGTLVISK